MTGGDTLSPCPFCRKKDPRLASERGFFAVVCATCKASGPLLTDPLQAVAGWNTRPAAEESGS